MVQRVSGRGHREFQAPLGLRGHRVLWVFQDKGSPDYQEHQGNLGHRDTQEMENLECPGSQENLGALDYLEQKVNLVQVVVKDPQGLLALGGCQAHLDSQGYPNQGGKACQGSLEYSESLDKKVSQGCLVLQAPKGREDWDSLVYQV